KLSRKVLGVDRDVRRVLTAHPWKGNVRELEHVLERAMILGDGEVITLRDLPPGLVPSNCDVPASDALREVTRHVEREHILTVLARTRSDKREAARVLGISLASLYRKIGELDINVTEKLGGA